VRDRTPERGAFPSAAEEAGLWIGRLQCYVQSAAAGDECLSSWADVTQQTLARSAIRYVEPGSRIDTDDFRGARLLNETHDHRTVDHEETYVAGAGTHCNTAEGE